MPYFDPVLPSSKRIKFTSLQTDHGRVPKNYLYDLKGGYDGRGFNRGVDADPVLFRDPATEGCWHTIDEAKYRFELLSRGYKGARNLTVFEPQGFDEEKEEEQPVFPTVEDSWYDDILAAPRAGYRIPDPEMRNLNARGQLSAVGAPIGNQSRTSGRAHGWEMLENPAKYPTLPISIPMSVDTHTATDDGERINDGIVQAYEEAVFPMLGGF